MEVKDWIQIAVEIIGNGIVLAIFGKWLDIKIKRVERKDELQFSTVKLFLEELIKLNKALWITDNAIFIKEQYTDKFTLEFLTEMMKIMDFHQYADFSGQPKITQKPLETLEYLTPPIDMQNEFTEFCKQVDKSKVVA